jgi:penicillin-binding protein 1C
MQLAWLIERDWSKTEILEAYLNLVSFRGELQGVAAAASVLFGKAPHGITEAEAVVLAVLVKAPNANVAAVLRRAEVLAGAVHDTARSTAEHDSLVQAAARALSASAGTTPHVALAPHAARRLLRATAPVAAVATTLDANVQRTAIDALRRQLLALRTQQVEDGAALVADNSTGDVLAYVGSSGDLSRAPHVDGVQARRQAGSTLKPFLYVLALEQRLLTPASLLEDTPLEIAVPGGVYRPQNYDEQFRGLVNVRTALAGSLNIPAVRTLQLVGAESFVWQLRRLGFAGLQEAGDYYGPSLALGSADVSLWELVNGYRALANGGAWSSMRLAPDVSPDDPHRVFSAGAAFLVSNILADRESRSVTFGLDNPLATRFWTAVKTGTSKEMRDNWCVGFSRRYTVGVWVGNFSGAPMHDVSGVSGAAPAWLEIMEWLHRDLPSPPPEPPVGVVLAATTPNVSGAEGEQWFLAGTEPATAVSRVRHVPAKIVAPVSGTVIAVDPDIPTPQQRVAFEAQADSGTRGHWVLDGKRIGPAMKPLLWAPQPGPHTLVLVDERQHPVDTVAFSVRGSVGRTTLP